MTRFEISRAPHSRDIDFVVATPDLLRDYYGRDPPYTVLAGVAVREGKAVGIAGLYFAGHQAIAFTEYKPEAGLSRRDKVRGAMVILDLIEKTTVPVLAIATSEFSVPLMAKRGFVPTGFYTDDGPVMRHDPVHVERSE